MTAKSIRQASLESDAARVQQEAAFFARDAEYHLSHALCHVQMGIGAACNAQVLAKFYHDLQWAKLSHLIGSE